MTLENQNMLSRLLLVNPDGLSFVSVESKVQSSEYLSSPQHKNFHEVISSLGAIFEAITSNQENVPQEIDSNKMFGREYQNKHRYRDQVISHLRPLESKFPHSIKVLFAPTQSQDRNDDFEIESISEWERDDGNFLMLASEVIDGYLHFEIGDLPPDARNNNIIFRDKVQNRDDSYQIINSNSSFDERILVRNDKRSIIRSQEFNGSHHQYVSDLPVVVQSDYMDKTSIDVNPMSQLLRSRSNANSTLKNSLFSMQAGNETLSDFLDRGSVSSYLQWSRRENVDSLTTEGWKTTILPLELSTALISSVLSDLNLPKSISPEVGGGQIPEDLITSKLKQGETVNVYSQPSLNIPSNKSLKADFDNFEPILVISIEEKNLSPDVKFMSSSRELIDLMAQKQSYLRMTFKNFGIEGYDFLFQAGGNEMQDRQRRVYENIQSEKCSILCNDQVEFEFTVFSGIDKRI